MASRQSNKEKQENKEKKSSTSAESKKRSSSGGTKEVESDRDLDSDAVASDLDSESIASDQMEVDEEIDGEDIDKLLELFSEEDLAAADVNVSMDMIDIWHDALQHSGEPGLKEISKTIAKLKKQIEGGKSKAEDIGEMLSQLGEQVDNYANGAPAQKTKLHKLGKAIKKAGRNVVKEQVEEE